MLSPVILTPPRTDRNPAPSGHRPRAFAACSGELEEGRQTSPGVSGSRSAARLPACDCLHVRTHPQATAWAGCTAAVPGRNGQCLGRLYWYRGTGYISAPIPLGLALCFSRQRKRLLTPFHIVNIGRPLQSPSHVSYAKPRTAWYQGGPGHRCRKSSGVSRRQGKQRTRRALETVEIFTRDAAWQESPGPRYFAAARTLQTRGPAVHRRACSEGGTLVPVGTEP